MFIFFFKLCYTYKVMFGLSYIWNILPNFRKYNRIAEKDQREKTNYFKIIRTQLDSSFCCRQQDTLIG